MIFVSSGTQFPFDRFIKILDEVAPTLNEEIIAQVAPDKYQARNLRVVDKLSQEEFLDYMRRARVVVSHAGMGTILSAMNMDKPIVIFPRKASLGEHRNEHQLATARELERLGYVYVAYTPDQLIDYLRRNDLHSLHKISDCASPSLSQYVADFIEGK